MELKELKLGNYCYCQDEINVIYGITKEGFVQYEKDNNVYYCGIDALKPIELTEEILLKCGFVKDGGCVYRQFKYALWLYDHSPKYAFMLYDEKDSKHEFDYNVYSHDLTYVKNLHHLQNIWFSLTGFELEIKL